MTTLSDQNTCPHISYHDAGKARFNSYHSSYFPLYLNLIAAIVLVFISSFFLCHHSFLGSCRMFCLLGMSHFGDFSCWGTVLGPGNHVLSATILHIFSGDICCLIGSLGGVFLCVLSLLVFRMYIFKISHPGMSLSAWRCLLCRGVLLFSWHPINTIIHNPRTSLGFCTNAFRSLHHRTSRSWYYNVFHIGYHSLHSRWTKPPTHVLPMWLTCLRRWLGTE